MLVFEDVHWADEATLDLLRFLGKRMRTLPVLLLVSYRDDEIVPGHPLRRCLAQLATERSTRRVDVPRLTPAGVGVLAAGSGLSADELHHLTSGNPFFLTEVLRDPGNRLPASAREAVLGRIDGLSRPARRALDVAALLGTRVDLSMLSEVAQPSPEAVDELVDSGLLVPDGTGLRFRHEITRRTVEDSLPPHRSAPLHGRILALLRARDSDDDARLAYHAEGASDAAAVQAHATLAARRGAELGCAPRGRGAVRASAALGRNRRRPCPGPAPGRPGHRVRRPRPLGRLHGDPRERPRGVAGGRRRGPRG